MNKKLILTGKAVLSTVMASTMACSLLSTNVYAQESGLVTDEETTVEKAPVVDEETTTTEEATEVVEEADVVTESSETVTVNTVVDTPTTYKLPPDDYGYNSLSEQELRVKIRELLDEAASLYEENKYRPSTESDYLTNKETAEAALSDTTLSHEKLAWQAYYMANSVKAMNSTQNLLSETAKQIVIINKQVKALNPAEYQLEAWNTLTDALSNAIARINGNAANDYAKELENIKELYDIVLQSKVDENLTALKNLVSECETIVQNQLYPSRRVNYTRESYAAFTNALNAARIEVDKGGIEIDPDLAKTLITNLTNAKNGLIEIDENTKGQEYGISNTWAQGFDGQIASYNKSNKIRGGSLYISGYEANDDETVKVTVTWENSGVDPVTGGMFHNAKGSSAYNFWDAEYSLRPFTEKDVAKKDVKLSSTIILPDGKYASSYIDVNPLSADEVLNGFQKEFIVPAEATIDLKLTQTGNSSDAAYTTSLGTYYVPKAQQIDKEAPNVTVDYSTIEKTKNPVTVTITADEAIQDISGWTKIEENKYQKIYNENATEMVDVVDLAGNVRTVNVTVSNIIKSDVEKPTKPSGGEKEDSKKTKGTKTGVFTTTGLFAGSATAAAAGASLLAFLKKRKK